MARSGWSTSNFLRAPVMVTAAPLTIAAWARTSITGTWQNIAIAVNSAGASNKNCFGLLVQNTNQVRAQTSDTAGPEATADCATLITANTWFHAAGVFTSATNRAAFHNGGNKATNTTSRIPTGINRFSIGTGDSTPNGSEWAPAGTGMIAEVGLWNVALTDAEIAALASGVSPVLVRPQSLIGYWPLWGGHSPEVNLVSNTNSMAVNGSLSAAAHPRVTMPKRRGVL